VLFGSSLVQQSADPARDATTNERLVVSAGVAAAVKQALHLNDSAASIENQVKASSQSDADIVQVIVRDTDPARAARIANEFVKQFIVLRAAQDRAKVQAAITYVRNQLASLSPADTAERQQITTQMLPKLVALKSLQFGNAEVAGTAGVPGAAVSPSPKRDGAIALLLGVVLGGAKLLHRGGREHQGAQHLHGA
jgi:capsular polysaccharide biosynthesis protein